LNINNLDPVKRRVVDRSPSSPFLAASMKNPEAKDEGEKKQEHSPLRSLAIILALILMLLVARLAPCLCAAQQAPSPAPPSANNTTRGPQNVIELASFLNTTISDELSTYHIPGATVAVVKDGSSSTPPGTGTLT